MIQITTQRFRGLTKHRRITIGPLVYEYKRKWERTTRTLEWAF